MFVQKKSEFIISQLACYFWKLFGANDVDCIKDILNFVDYRPLATKIDAQKIVFLFARTTVIE